MVNVTSVALAGTRTTDGTAKTFVMPPEIATAAPSDGAARLNVMVQVEFALEARPAGAHCSDETNTGPVAVTVVVRDRVADAEEPFSDAVTVALRLAVMEPALTVNVAVLALPTTATEAGTVRTPAMPPETTTTTPPDGAAVLNVIVQVVLAFGPRLAAAHCRDETCAVPVVAVAVADSVRVAVRDAPLKDAVTLALWFELNWPAETVKFPPVDPAAIARVVDAILMLPAAASETVTPPEGAGPLSVTAQLETAPGLRELELHAKAVMVRGWATELRLIVPPDTVIARALPVDEAPIAPVTPILMLDEPETVADTVAITPLGMRFAFIPLAIQVRPPLNEAHAIVLPAAVRIDVAVTAALVTVPG